MCSNIKIISKTENGIVFKCNECKNFEVKFNNLDFSFSDEEYYYFNTYINSIDVEFYIHQLDGSPYPRKIQLPIGHKNLLMALTIDELKELQQLFKHQIESNYTLISYSKIHYKLFMN